MQANPTVVKALMMLRGIDDASLANLATTPYRSLCAWLYDGDDEAVPFETQLEILRYLGVYGDTLRSDIVHYWRVHEPLFSRFSTNYWALETIIKAFGGGKVQAIYLARESDPAITLKARARFGLRFPGFLAILDVTAHPLRNISFDPNRLPDTSWVPDTFGVLLPEAEYDALEPGSMKTRGLTQYLTYTEQVRQWEQLREVAMERGVSPQQVASMLLGNAAGPALEATAPQAAAPAPTRPEAASPAPAPLVEEARDETDDLFSRPVAPVRGSTEEAPHLRRVS